MVDVSRLPGPISETWDWQRLAACRGRNSDMFFHPRAERGRVSPTRLRVSVAKGGRVTCARR